MGKKKTAPTSIKELFPDAFRILLTGGGKEFIERIGLETARSVVLNVMMGGNIRDQTEPLTRRRITQISGAVVAMFVRGALEIEDFTNRLSDIAIKQIQDARRSDREAIWPAQWLIGLTGKSVQNVLRSNHDEINNYIREFESIIEESAIRFHTELGDLRMSLGFTEDVNGRRVELGWKEIARITTAIGSQTLTIRGAEKSMYGKLFEKLILGSFLTLMGFERVNPANNTKSSNVFWLSDSSASRESDATVIFKPGKVARFDIGFIGPGNSEISKDKLSRYEREFETSEGQSESITFIVVDRLPKTGKTEKAARRIGAELIQMSMQFWPRYLAQRLKDRLGVEHELQNLPDSEIGPYLETRLESIPILDFLSGISAADLQKEEEEKLPDASDEIEALGLESEFFEDDI